MSNITVVEVPSSIKPSDPTTYFPEEQELIEWTKAHTKVPGMHRQVIPSGTRLAALVEVVKGHLTGLPLMRVANTSCGADSFELIEGSDQLSRYVGSMVAVALTIGERTGDHYCHGSSYTVRSVTLAALPLNPSREQLRHLLPGTHFVVQGQFVRYYEETPGRSVPDTTSHLTHGRIVIATPSGELTLDSFRPHMKEPSYAGGVLENLRDKRMIPGETVRITGFISEADDLRGLHAGMATVGYNQPYLLVPNAQRLSDYGNLRLQVAATTDAMRRQIATRQWSKARITFAELRKLELTQDEASLVVEIMEGVTVEQRSVYYGRQFGANDIERAFGIDPETLNRADFLAYAREIMLGIRENPVDKSRRTDQTYLLRFWRTKHSILTVESLVELLREAIPARLSRLEQCSDEHDAYWDDYYLLDQCIEHLRYWGQSDVDKAEDVDPSLVRVIIDTVEYCIAQGYYRVDREISANQVPRRLVSVLGTCLRSLAEAYMYQPVVREMVTPALVKNWFGRLESAGADPNIISELRRNVPRR